MSVTKYHSTNLLRPSIPNDYMIFEETVLYIVDTNHVKIGEVRVNDVDGKPCITYIYVDTDHRAKGLGTHLMNDIISVYGHRDIYFQARSFHNSPMNIDEMQQWIARFNFKPVSDYPGGMKRKADVS